MRVMSSQHRTEFSLKRIAVAVLHLRGCRNRIRFISPAGPESVNGYAFRWALEQSAIFMRWREAFDARRTGDETFPALPEERPRYEELKAFLGNRLKRPAGAGTFRALPQFKDLDLGARVTGQVRWNPLSPPSDSE